MIKNKIAIIGGGPAGMMAAVVASKNNEVFLFEKNEKLGKKLFITGKGRCNFTNDCDEEELFENIITNKKFMYSSLNNFNNKNIIKFFEDNNMEVKIERGKRVFPKSDKAYEVTDCLKRILLKQNVNILYNSNVLSIKLDNTNSKFLIKYNNNNKNLEDEFDKVIIATGGMSYKSTGSTGDGYKFAKDFGINVTQLEPSLVPVEVFENDDILELDNLTLKNVSIKVIKDNKALYKDFGEMSFYKYGLTGPIILSTSAIISNSDIKNAKIYIDLKPALDDEKLRNRIIREVDKHLNINDLLHRLLPSQFVKVFMNRLKNINFDKITVDMTKFEREEIIKNIKEFGFTLKNKRTFDEAIVTKGGIDCKQINSKTMESKTIKNLYFAGEVLDIDCFTGGFNITIALSTGYTAGLLL